MTAHLYRSGVHAWEDWLAQPHVWLCIAGYHEFNSFDDTIADLAAIELSGYGYARVPLSNPVLYTGDEQSAGASLTRVYGADDPTFTGMGLENGSGQPIGALVLAEQGGNDATSRLIVHWDGWWNTAAVDLTFQFHAWENNGVPYPGGSTSTRMIAQFGSMSVGW